MLELDRVAKRFGDVVACADVSLTVRYGEVHAVAGGGKTTVARIAAGVLTPDDGAVRRSGERLGYLPASRGLYPRMKVLDQLEYLAALHGLDASSALRSAELWAARFGLRAVRFDRVRQLPAEDQRRLWLAAAFVGAPDVLVLDEPFDGLDPETAEAVVTVVREFATAGAAVLLATDEPSVVEGLCDRATLLHNGRVVTEGAVSELRAAARVELEVSAPSAPPDWADGLPGVSILSVHNGHFRLALTDGADDQAVLAAAMAAGPVRSFTVVRTGLAELFRDVVGAP
ncbi:ABC transporter ATP-binding protein [Actinophytocola oryzae]|uniref:ABC-2 type transport system ATP-binding protein n=1 Tax=Actinophytocola oryzae TaxID=502181 RepID=A0A4R7UZT6_9PSEU|nr:ATP-binding cassette domain-containing protein [Actinophytocola oryzae]TDV41784.1 ABC-2 type transport system ATP-binding protein [Actinophytocola oryzae]